ncbi:DUF3293 domain-containing protein [Wenzhouxiangella sediminis]|nr:DUF3293 domain-containing protein [Wenzhouxiangella sediminis]
MNIDVASNSPESLLQAFAATDYRVRIAGRELIVRPGLRQPDLDEALRHRSWAIVTAFNPGGTRISAARNRARHRRLLDTVGEAGIEFHPAVNRDPGGDWPDEVALLLVDITRSRLDALADTFDQAAVVTGRPGRAAILRLYGEGWPSPLPDWAGHCS